MMDKAFEIQGGGLDLTLDDINQAEYALAIRLSCAGSATPDKEAVRRALLMFERIRQTASHHPSHPIRVYLTHPVGAPPCPPPPTTT